MDEDLEKTAYHEAGHALLAVLAGAAVVSLTIDPDWDDGPERHGDIAVRWNLRGYSAEESLHRKARVALAGPVAEMIYSGDAYHPALVREWSSDWSTAWQLTTALIPAPERAMQFLEQLTRDLYRFLNHTPHWAALSALADELLAHETLSGEDVTGIVAQWIEI